MDGTLEEKLRVLALAGAIGTMSVLTACSYDSSKGGSYRIEAGGSVSGKIYVEVSKGDCCDHRHAHRTQPCPPKKHTRKSKQRPTSQAQSWKPRLYQSLPYGPGQGHVEEPDRNIAIYAAPSSSGGSHNFPVIRFENQGSQQRLNSGTTYNTGSCGPSLGPLFFGSGSCGPIPGTNYCGPVPRSCPPPRPVARSNCWSR